VLYYRYRKILMFQKLYRMTYLMTSFTNHMVLAWLFLLSAFSVNVNAIDEDMKKELDSITTSSIILHDQVIIDKPLSLVWPEVLDFISWYFRGHDVQHLDGRRGELGSAAIVNGKLLHEIVSLKKGKTVVWKTCLLAACDNNIVFTDFTIQDSAGKTKLNRRTYSHGFWSEKIAKDRLRDISRGVVPEDVRKVAFDFKAYVESLD